MEKNTLERPYVPIFPYVSIQNTPFFQKKPKLTVKLKCSLDKARSSHIPLAPKPSQGWLIIVFVCRGTPKTDLLLAPTSGAFSYGHLPVISTYNL